MNGYRESVINVSATAFVLLFAIVATPSNAQNQYPEYFGEIPVVFDDIEDPGGEYIVTDRSPGELDLFQFRGRGNNALVN